MVGSLNLNVAFSALADPTRRTILARLAKGEATVMELAKPFEMTQPAISQHLKVLEDARLVACRVAGTKRPRRRAKAGIEAMDQWLAMLRKALEENYDRLDEILAGMEQTKIKKEDKKRRKTMSKLTLKTEGNTHVVVTRRFAVPPQDMYRAHTDPKLVQKWLLGPEGWTMPSASLTRGRAASSVMSGRMAKGMDSTSQANTSNFEPYSRIVHVERMHLPDPTPDNHVETRFAADGTGTLMTMRMTLPDAQTRAAMLATGMEASYVRLEGMI
jgi:DNA-binding transcriptional ArsR family regulator/uncharacterized protein YndB with AHSA1/START domain